jgi:phage recombination protein Bet
MSTALAERPTAAPPAIATVTSSELDLVKRTVAQGATDAELKLYLYDCQRQGVHPLDRLLHFTKRGNKYTPVTSIDLMRIRASETGEYAGSDDAAFQAGASEPIHAATVTVWRLVQGTRCPFTATARWSEYYPGEQSGHMWRKMPHTMLAKCAEALALRKGFPRQLAGLYAKEELDQAERSAPPMTTPTATVEAGAVVNTETGEELPDPPAGYHYVSDYSLRNGWHEFKLLKYDAQGGYIRLSTKKPIGSVAEQAQAERIPVRVTTSSKKNGSPGEAYLDTIEKLRLEDLPTLKPFAKEPPKADAEIVPTACEVCGKPYAECKCDDLAF